jgi:hypothetical protein
MLIVWKNFYDYWNIQLYRREAIIEKISVSYLKLILITLVMISSTVSFSMISHLDTTESDLPETQRIIEEWKIASPDELPWDDKLNHTEN